MNVLSIWIPLSELGVIKSTLESLGYDDNKNDETTRFYIRVTQSDYKIIASNGFPRFILHIYNEKMLENPIVRELLLEYLI